MKIRLNAAQTQALVSLLCTLGQYVNMDIEHEPGSNVEVTIWRNGEDNHYRIEGDGYTVEI